ncbi:unnamed protein product [Notodromas monacha]|uniref:Palmitoyltransferase n=1 Tax=Notodromas monacha TaxID=399045 RepID=A0A7R9BGF6_9CRUS|nr:unnamed protein product [Notodromas monacha]CAG0914822.1 unnamed protein product [Notodromas monacha]
MAATAEAVGNPNSTYTRVHRYEASLPVKIVLVLAVIGFLSIFPLILSVLGPILSCMAFALQLFLLKLEPRERRRHGLQRPFSAMQWICILYTCAAILVFYGIICVNFGGLLGTVFAVVGGVLFAVVASAYFSASLIDPAHEALRKRIPPSQEASGPNTVFCRTCKIYMTVEDKVKHCRSCGRCVPMFDHHCPALNNCVGKRNFKITIVLFNAGLLLAVFLDALVGLLVFGYLVKPELLVREPGKGGLLMFGFPVKAIVVFPLLGVFALVNTAVVISLIALVAYHWYNIFAEMTTYDQILQERQGNSKRYSVCLSKNLFTCLGSNNKRRRDEVPPNSQVSPNPRLSNLTISSEWTEGNRSSRTTNYDELGVRRSMTFDEQWDRVRQNSKDVNPMSVKFSPSATRTPRWKSNRHLDMGNPRAKRHIDGFQRCQHFQCPEVDMVSRSSEVFVDISKSSSKIDDEVYVDTGESSYESPSRLQSSFEFTLNNSFVQMGKKYDRTN